EVELVLDADSRSAEDREPALGEIEVVPGRDGNGSVSQRDRGGAAPSLPHGAALRGIERADACVGRDRQLAAYLDAGVRHQQLAARDGGNRAGRRTGA